MRRSTLAALALIAACSTGGAPDPPSTLQVAGAWARSADSGTVSAAYLTLVNHEAATVTLLSVDSPLAESVTLHETMAMNGMVHMMNLDAPQVVAPGDSLVMREGGKHLMVNGLRRQLAAGDSLPLELSFMGGRTLRAAAVVRAP